MGNLWLVISDSSKLLGTSCLVVVTTVSVTGSAWLVNDDTSVIETV